MSILFRSEYIGDVNKFDIPVAHKPLGTKPGDFMLMRIITTTNKEQIPTVPGWSYVIHEYLPNACQFVFSKIDDGQDDRYNIIRKKSGNNYIRVYSFYSDVDYNILVNFKSITLQTSLKRLRFIIFDIDDYSIKYNYNENNAYHIKLLNKRFPEIDFSIYENNIIYKPKITIPVILDTVINDNNSVTLKWEGLESYNIEVAVPNESWKVINQNPIKDTVYTVTNLLPSTKYFFRIIAVRNDIVSMPSRTVEIRTYDKILLRSTVKNSSSTMNPHILVSPPKVQKGDLMIMQVSLTADTSVTKISHGWKLLQQLKNSVVSCNIYYKVATQKEPASYFVQHNGLKTQKILMAIAAFYSSSGLPIKIGDSAIQYNPTSNYIHYPQVTLEGDYSLGIALSVRNLESSLKLPIDTTIIWDTDKNLRTTGIFQGYNNIDIIAPVPIYCNQGSSISATISLIEGVHVDTVPPLTPTGLKIRQVEGTTIRLS